MEPNEPLLSPVGQDDIQIFIDSVLEFEGKTQRLSGIVAEIGEQRIAHLLNAQLRANKTGIGWDAWSNQYGRIQIRSRMPDIEDGPPANISLKGECDTFVFAYLDRSYQLSIVQVLTEEEAIKLRSRYEKNVPIKQVITVGERLCGQGINWPPFSGNIPVKPG